jgi:hypothetical protein
MTAGATTDALNVVVCAAKAVRVNKKVSKRNPGIALVGPSDPISQSQ